MRLIHGDCLVEMDKLIQEGVEVDLTLTSPPYNLRNRVYKGQYMERKDKYQQKYQNFSDALPIDDYYDFHKQALEKMLKLSKVVLWNIQIITGSKEAVFKIIGHFHKNLKDIIVWDKGYAEPSMQSGIINRGTELILVFEKDTTIGRQIQNPHFKHGSLNDLWKIKRPRHPKGHSATFPIELVETAIRSFSPENGVVMDCFMGSGTTGVVCNQLNRDFIGIELVKDYFDYSKERIEKINNNSSTLEKFIWFSQNNIIFIIEK